MVSKSQKGNQRRIREAHPKVSPPQPPVDPDAKKNRRKRIKKTRSERKRLMRENEKSGSLKDLNKLVKSEPAQRPIIVSSVTPPDSCFLCNAKDHLTKFCPERAQWEKDEICLLCRKRGHSLNKCPSQSGRPGNKERYCAGKTEHPLSNRSHPVNDGKMVNAVESYALKPDSMSQEVVALTPSLSGKVSKTELEATKSESKSFLVPIERKIKKKKSRKRKSKLKSQMDMAKDTLKDPNAPCSINGSTKQVLEVHVGKLFPETAECEKDTKPQLEGIVSANKMTVGPVPSTSETQNGELNKETPKPDSKLVLVPIERKIKKRKTRKRKSELKSQMDMSKDTLKDPNEPRLISGSTKQVLEVHVGKLCPERSEGKKDTRPQLEGIVSANKTTVGPVIVIVEKQSIHLESVLKPVDDGESPSNPLVSTSLTSHSKNPSSIDHDSSSS